MLLRKIIGIIIIVLNIGGFGFLLFMTGLMLKKKYFNEEQTFTAQKAPAVKKQETAIINDNIIPDEDDLFKDMDLSDIDNLDLDDFK